jgi:hypothetical protein
MLLGGYGAAVWMGGESNIPHHSPHCGFDLGSVEASTPFQRGTTYTRSPIPFCGNLCSKGCPIPTIAAIIDGTLKKVACPSCNQRILFNGWKHIHCLKYHLLVASDGIIIHAFGLVEGRRHDMTLLKESRLIGILEKHFWGPNGEHYFVYVDLVYQTGGHIMAPYKGTQITEEQCAWNAKMSKICEPVEWMFKEVNSVFKFLNFSENQQVLVSLCGLFYMVALLLTNAHTILHRSQTSQYFRCTPPSLQEYFHGEPIGDELMDEWCKTAPWGEVDIALDNDSGDEADGDDHMSEM